MLIQKIVSVPIKQENEYSAFDFPIELHTDEQNSYHYRAFLVEDFEFSLSHSILSETTTLKSLINFMYGASFQNFAEERMKHWYLIPRSMTLMECGTFLIDLFYRLEEFPHSIKKQDARIVEMIYFHTNISKGVDLPRHDTNTPWRGQFHASYEALLRQIKPETERYSFEDIFQVIASFIAGQSITEPIPLLSKRIIYTNGEKLFNLGHRINIPSALSGNKYARAIDGKPASIFAIDPHFLPFGLNIFETACLEPPFSTVKISLTEFIGRIPNYCGSFDKSFQLMLDTYHLPLTPDLLISLHKGLVWDNRNCRPSNPTRWRQEGFYYNIAVFTPSWVSELKVITEELNHFIPMSITNVKGDVTPTVFGGEDFDPKLMDNVLESIIEKYYKEQGKATEVRDKLKNIAWIACLFSLIHPFQDANGRIATLLINRLLLEEQLSPTLLDCNVFPGLPLDLCVRFMEEGQEHFRSWTDFSDKVAQSKNAQSGAFCNVAEPDFFAVSQQSQNYRFTCVRRRF